MFDFLLRLFPLFNKNIAAPKELIKLLELQAGKKIKPLFATRFLHPKNAKNGSIRRTQENIGIAVPGIPKEKAIKIFKDSYEEFTKEGFLLFLTNLGFDKNYNAIFDLGVIKASDQFELIVKLNTQAPNYNITNEQIVKKLKEWEMIIPFRIRTVDDDRVEAEILKMPEDVRSFTKEIFKFCPDTVYQGAGTLDKLAEEIEKDRYFWLWWD